jgi:hypothetical protein
VFNGTSSFIEVVDDPGGRFDFGDEGTRTDSPFSYSVWVYLLSSNNTKIIMSKGYEYMFRTDSSGRLMVTLFDEWSVGDYMTKVINRTALIDTWVHVAFTYDGSSTVSGIKIYRNGIKGIDYDTEFSGYVAMVGTPEDSYRIGRGSTDSWQSAYFGGKIKDSILYSKELSQAEITQIYNGTPLGSNIVVNHKLYVDALDSGPNGLHGVNTDVTFSQE